MTNAPLELARVFVILRDAGANASWHTRLAHLGDERGTDELGAMRLLACLTAETEKCIDDLEATGYEVGPFRQRFPAWAQAAFRARANPSAGMNSAGVINEDALALLQILGHTYERMPIAVNADDVSHLQEALAQAFEFITTLPLSDAMQGMFALKFIRARKLLDAPSQNKMRVIESLCEIVGLMTLAIEALPVEETEKEGFRRRNTEHVRSFFRDVSVDVAGSGFVAAAMQLFIGS